MIIASLGLNIVVLVPVCLGLLTKAPWTISAYGADTPARAILVAMYAAILICSAGLLVRPIPTMVATLLVVQIVYKVMTPFTVGSFGHPVVLSNLAIAGFHCITVWAIWRGGIGS